MVYFRNFRVDIHASLSIDLWMNLRLCTWLLVMRTYNKPSWHGALCKCSVVERSQYDWFVCRFAFLSRKLFLRRAVAQLAAARHSSLGHVLLSSRRQYNQDQTVSPHSLRKKPFRGGATIFGDTHLYFLQNLQVPFWYCISLGPMDFHGITADRRLGMNVVWECPNGQVVCGFV